MMTTQGKLLVTSVWCDLHGQCVLHNWENTESPWQCSAVSTENVIHVSCNGTITEHVVEDGCFSSAPASVILTHYIIAVDLATAPTLTFSAVPEAHSWPVRGTKEKCLTCPCPADEGIVASSYRPQALLSYSVVCESLYIVLRGTIVKNDKIPFVLFEQFPCWSYLLDSRSAGRWTVQKTLIPKILSGLHLNLPAW